MPKLPKLVLILEMQMSRDHASEGSFLAEYLRVLNVPTDLQVIRTALSRPQAAYVHISSHGGKSDAGTTFAVTDGAGFSVADLDDLQGLLQGRTVVATGCQTGSADMGRQMLAVGCKLYIAPRRITYWADAAVFAALLYRRG